jgi:hypothetical protein
MAIYPFLFKKIWFILAVVILPLVLAFILAEFTVKKREKHRRTQVADYGTVKNEGQLGRGGCLKENLTLYVTDGQGGRVRWTNNSAGFRNDEEFSLKPPPGTLRILSLGDSFTAGYRVGQHETFSYLLEQWIGQHYGKSEVMVSEIEEPATALYYLSKFGLAFHPQIVLLGITLGNDIGQAYIGLDPKGKYSLKVDHDQVTIEPKTAEISESSLQNYMIPAAYLERPGFLRKQFYELRRGFKRLWLMRGFYKDNEGIVSWYDAENPPRLFDFGNALGMFMQPPPPLIDEAYQRLFRVLSAMQTICKQHQIILAVEIFPQRFQVQPPDWESAVEKYRISKGRFDLMNPNKKIRQFCLQQNIAIIDPTREMAKYYAKSGNNMYLPFGDMHWNKTGHRAFFECSLPAFANLVQEGFQQARDSYPSGLPRHKIPPRSIGHQPGSMTSRTN